MSKLVHGWFQGCLNSKHPQCVKISIKICLPVSYMNLFFEKATI